jgi:hypothetical protein
MSLGLKDLQKKSRTAQPKAPPAQKATAMDTTMNTKMGTPKNKAARPKFPAGAWATRGTTARPWTDAGLSKTTRSRKSQVDSDATINEEWVSLLSTPWFFVECGPESRFVRLQKQILKLEEQLHSQWSETLETIGETITEKIEDSPIYNKIANLPILRNFL